MRAIFISEEDVASTKARHRQLQQDTCLTGAAVTVWRAGAAAAAVGGRDCAAALAETPGTVCATLEGVAVPCCPASQA